MHFVKHLPRSLNGSGMKRLQKLVLDFQAPKIPHSPTPFSMDTDGGNNNRGFNSRIQTISNEQICPYARDGTSQGTTCRFFLQPPGGRVHQRLPAVSSNGFLQRPLRACGPRVSANKEETSGIHHATPLKLHRRPFKHSAEL